VPDLIISFSATIVKRVVVDAELIEGETIRKIGN